jgi:polyisoprenyl-phosphate glycosyltransferase
MTRCGVNIYNNMKKISIVVPVYLNELNLPETIPILLGLSDKLSGYQLELVLVDDGSYDNSLDIMLRFQEKYPDIIKIVKLTRNFGSMSAIQAGFTIATGDCVGMISADLQDPPELFLEMVNYWEKGIKAIFAIRQGRNEPLLQKWFSNTYYSLIRKFAIDNYPNGGFDYFLIDKQIVSELNRINEKNTNIMTLIYWLGYHPVMIPYTRQARSKGKSHWTLTKKIKLFVDTFVAFSFFPIRLLTILGFIVALGSVIYGIFILIYWFYFGVDVKGWVNIMVIMTFTSGIQMTMLGVLGEYLWRTLDEVRRRPAYVIDTIYENNIDTIVSEGKNE